MSIEWVGPIAAALGVGAILQAAAARYLGRPGPTGADSRLADAQADKARAEADALAWAAMRAELDRMAVQVNGLVIQVGTQADQISTYRMEVARLTAEVDRLRSVEVADKKRIAELEARVDELESDRRLGASGGAGA